MEPYGFDEQLVAEELLFQFGDEAERRGHPMSFVLRPSDANWFDFEEVDRPSGLLGYVVERDWSSVATVATGRFRRLDPSAELPARLIPGLQGGLRMACVLSRDGGIGWNLELPDGTRWDQVPEEGFVLDVLRRSLQLPTPPPTTTAAEMHLIGWFTVAVGLASERRTRLSWDDLVDIHRTGCGFPDGAEWDQNQFFEILKASPPWDEVRVRLAEFEEQAGPDLGSAALPPPELARWMDAGMFSRWMTREMPTLEELMRDLRTRLHSAAYRHVCRLVHAVDQIDEVA